METNMFQNLNADDSDVMQIESLCLNCYEQGTTRLLLTKIPFFREIILSSFQCEYCNFSDCSIQSGSQIQEKGVHYKLTVKTPVDLNRQIIKSEYAHLSIPEIEFEQPSVRKGEISTVEGFIDSYINGLLLMQEKRKEIMPDSAAKIDAFIEKLKDLKKIEKPFTIIIEDSSGNSFIENPLAPVPDNNLIETHYTRSKEQDEEVGCSITQIEENEIENVDNEIEDSAEINLKREVLNFPVQCPNCKAMCDSRMKLLDIPHFKQVVVMATVCDFCGHRDNEVRSASGIEPLGTKITLHVLNKNDLSRDVIKSDTASVSIPELDFEMGEGTLGGIYTTVEGLISQAANQLSEKNPFICGDSAVPGTKNKISEFCDKLKNILIGDMDFHLIIDDSAGNSFIQNNKHPEVDAQLLVETYERNYQQNDELGLNDMNTDHYILN